MTQRTISRVLMAIGGSLAVEPVGCPRPLYLAAMADMLLRVAVRHPDFVREIISDAFDFPEEGIEADIDADRFAAALRERMAKS